MLEETHRRRTYWLVALGLTALWAIAAFILVPRLIAAAYAGTSLPVLNGIITGQRVHPLAYYLDLWRRLACISSAALVAAVAVLYAWLRWGHVVRARLERTLGPERIGLIDTAVLACGVGLVAGEFVAVSLLVRHLVDPVPTDGWFAERLWTAPVTMGLALMSRGVIAWLLLRVVRLHARQAIILVLGASAIYWWARSAIPGVHPYAAMVLSLGATVQLVRVTGARHMPQFARVTRWTTAVATLVIACLGFGVGGARRYGERRAVSALPSGDPRLPNVVLLVLDTVEAQALSLYGAPYPTSRRLAEFARSGVVFDQAYATSPWTLPSHASLLTGLLPFEHHADLGAGIDPGALTLGEALRAHGYETAGFVANTVWLQPNTGVARGFIHYEAATISLRALLQGCWVCDIVARRLQPRGDVDASLDRKDADAINRAVLAWLDRRTSRRPFFAFLNYLDAHDPYHVQTPFDRMFRNASLARRIRTDRHHYTADELRALENGHLAAVAFLDDRVGRLLDALRARGLLQHTLIIVTADHGEEFGEKNPDTVGHGQTLDNRLLHVPLIVSMPGRVPTDRRVAAPVSLRSVPATIVNLIGLPDVAFPGRSLVTAWSDSSGSTPAKSDLVISELSAPAYGSRGLAAGERATRFPLSSLVDGQYHLVQPSTGPAELYRVSDDPFERANLGAQAPFQSLVERLTTALRAGLSVEHHLSLRAASDIRQ